jgi:hypothetical protein
VCVGIGHGAHRPARQLGTLWRELDRGRGPGSCGVVADEPGPARVFTTEWTL